MLLTPFRLATVLTVLLISPVAAKSVPLVNMNPASNTSLSFDEPNFDGTWGWTFYVNAPMTITHVGWFDEGGDGLSHSHRIGLWKDLSGQTTWPFVKTSQGFPRSVIEAEQLLGTFPPFLTEGVFVPAGESAELVGPWRRVALPNGPIELGIGGYVLGGLDDADSTDAIRYHLDWLATEGTGNSLPADPRIQIGAPGNSDGIGFQAPSYFFLVGGVELGPMLFVQPVPEPTCIGLAIVLWFCLSKYRLTKRCS